ncbi:unnamed protein product [Litomosoides sigmodontis]|uniref:EGF-like domain-containing protein n=1 Tax=Litomosoides sigmodontis TaxID=42156 RepID=A0A3P6U383_LITSI|nr:unnamed protein product [Litomosoides sigmodontis]
MRKDLKEMTKILTKAGDEKSREKSSFNLIKTDEEAICEDEICNNRGTCIGSKETNFCICKLGYSGMHCENSPCDSTKDCNGKGLCIGTSASYTCMCQLEVCRLYPSDKGFVVPSFWDVPGYCTDRYCILYGGKKQFTVSSQKLFVGECFEEFRKAVAIFSIAMEVCQKLKVSSQKAATNSYIDGSSRVDVCNEKDSVLLRTAVSRLSLEEIAEWLIKKEKILDRSIYGIVGKRLLKAAYKSGNLNNQEQKGILQRCITLSFRGIFMQPSGVDQKILKTLLKLQRELDVTANEQFVWLCLLPNTLKEKWTLLASVIPELRCDEKCVSENMLMAILWRAQARHSSGSVTSDCLLAWFLSGIGDLQNCARFLANCLISSNRMRRLNCSRFWLAKLNSNVKSKLIMKEAVEIILQMISTENQSIEQANEGYYLTEEEMCDLTSVDYFWNSEKEGMIWARYDRLLYGWVSIQRFFIRELKSYEIDLLHECLTSYHSLLRLDALELSKKLINKKLLDWSRQFGSIKSFVLRNLDITDINFCVTLLDFVHMSSAKARRRLEAALLKELDDVCNDRDRSYQTTFILDLLKQCDFDGWFADTTLLDSILNSDNADVRMKLLMCLSPAKFNAETFLTDKFVEMLNNDNTDMLSYLVKVILQFKEPKDILDLMKETNHKYSTGVKIVMTSLMENFIAGPLFDSIFWCHVCMKSNVDIILFSGSERSGQCASLPELYKRLYSSFLPTLMISDKQRKAIDQYYLALKVNCEMLASLCEAVRSRNIITDAYNSVWNVLMRSRHKGVVDDCSICFSRITACCVANHLHDVAYQYLEKTKRLSVDFECTTRNLAFCLVFRIYHEVLGTGNEIVNFVFENIRTSTPLIAIRLMKVLKTFLYMASFDVSHCTVKIFKSLLDFYRTDNSMVRNAACHCYAALVHKLIDDMEYGIPLFTFILRYNLLWYEYCQQLEQTTVYDPALILLLSLLEKLRFVSESFYTATQLKCLRSILCKLVSLLVMSPNLRINHLLISCLLRLIPYRKRLTYRLKKIMEHKLPLNIKNALSYAVSELEAMEFLDLPSDSLHSSYPHSTALLPNLVQKTHKILTDSTLERFEYFGALLMEIERHAYSSKELWRFYAAHALVMLSRSSRIVLTHVHCYRYRFISCCRSLVLDEVDCIKRVAFRAVNLCGGGTTLSYSWNPAVKLKLKKTKKCSELERPSAFANVCLGISDK